MLHSYHTLKIQIFQEKTGYFTETKDVNACLFSFPILCYTKDMTDIKKTILQKASGETRLDPDQQRIYMGTFRERVVLILTFDQVQAQTFQDKLPILCRDLSARFQPLTLKLSPSLSDRLQIAIIKTAQSLGLTTSIIDEKVGHSPYALVFHTDHAVDQEDISLEAVFPNLVKQEEKKEEQKTSFWKKLFG